MKKQTRQRPARRPFTMRLDEATRAGLQAAATAMDTTEADAARDILRQGLKRMGGCEQ